MRVKNVTTKADLDNRSDKLNHNNDAYCRYIGYDKWPADWQTKSEVETVLMYLLKAKN